MKTSKTGYLKNSPDVNKPQNIIQGGDITMKGVEFKVLGTDDRGYTKVMHPGYDYKFPGAKYVTETPIKKTNMESNKQKRANLLNNNPIASHGSWISKHSIAAGSPVHMGGSGKSPLYQDDLREGKIQDINSQNTSASVYKTPAVGGYGRDRYNVVRDMNKDTNYESPYTPEQLAERVDIRDGEAIPYNQTHGTVEIQGSDNPYGLKKRKSINLNDAQLNKSSVSAITQRASRNTQVPITNLEYDTNTWSAKNKRDFPRETKSLPQPTYTANAQSFDRNRRRDSLSKMNNRNFAAKNFKLNKQGQYLSTNTINEDEANRFINSIK